MAGREASDRFAQEFNCTLGAFRLWQPLGAGTAHLLFMRRENVGRPFLILSGHQSRVRAIVRLWILGSLSQETADICVGQVFKYKTKTSGYLTTSVGSLSCSE